MNADHHPCMDIAAILCVRRGFHRQHNNAANAKVHKAWLAKFNSRKNVNLPDAFFGFNQVALDLITMRSARNRHSHAGIKFSAARRKISPSQERPLVLAEDPLRAKRKCFLFWCSCCFADSTGQASAPGAVRNDYVWR